VKEWLQITWTYAVFVLDRRDRLHAQAVYLICFPSWYLYVLNFLDFKIPVTFI